ncbi:transferase activity protein [[Candida] boidinii]|uniref:Unnamed protein product n=1 Tax=Candida boidinii TaxID=5477 RepID=A0ACB5TM01_CANBO|nr:transferase activity protein [[Candida] boidinii]OWB61061.1 transferase activity protein [[Candida] boidinii]OWB71958.1 transferase activity protein [[Candida] boidinii]OWB80631.1 transferase activity protein [[Candida] boidinii]GME90849.1 unnamed protein product [[Candida] boidinii]
MSRNRRISDEAVAFYIATYEEICKIPPGKVCSYGHIARLIFRPQNSRLVGQALKNLPMQSLDPRLITDENDEIDNNLVSLSSRFNGNTVPWWRVVSSQGIISLRGNSNNVERQKEKLVEENVEVLQNRNGNYTINLNEFGWFPTPEDDDDSDDSDEDDDGD